MDFKVNKRKVQRYFDKKIKGTENNLNTKDWVMLAVYATCGKVEAVKAVKYAYILGLQDGRKAVQ